MLFCLVNLPIKDQDYLRLQFLGAKDVWLGCPDVICDLRTCPSNDRAYADENMTRCYGETFQIIGGGTPYASIKSGQTIRLRYVHNNTWIGCSYSRKYCYQTSYDPCPDVDISEVREFDKCMTLNFRIFAYGKATGQTIKRGDVVMLYFPYSGEYVTIDGNRNGDDSSLDFCPGMVPPAYLSYGICSKNVFRIYVPGGY